MTDDFLVVVNRILERRAFLNRHVPMCDCGERHQIQCREWLTAPAVWKCRTCKTKWEWEPEHDER